MSRTVTQSYSLTSLLHIVNDCGQLSRYYYNDLPPGSKEEQLYSTIKTRRVTDMCNMFNIFVWIYPSRYLRALSFCWTWSREKPPISSPRSTRRKGSRPLYSARRRTEKKKNGESTTNQHSDEPAPRRLFKFHRWKRILVKSSTINLSRYETVGVRILLVTVPRMSRDTVGTQKPEYV